MTRLKSKRGPSSTAGLGPIGKGMHENDLGRGGTQPSKESGHRGYDQHKGLGHIQSGIGVSNKVVSRHHAYGHPKHPGTMAKNVKMGAMSGTGHLGTPLSVFHSAPMEGLAEKSGPSRGRGGHKR